ERFQENGSENLNVSLQRHDCARIAPETSSFHKILEFSKWCFHEFRIHSVVLERVCMFPMCRKCRADKPDSFQQRRNALPQPQSSSYRSCHRSRSFRPFPERCPLLSVPQNPTPGLHPPEQWELSSLPERPQLSGVLDLVRHQTPAARWKA